MKVANEMRQWLKTDREKEALETLIQGLKESEDERIIKTLQEYVKNRNWPLNGPTQDEVLAWLEKQKEQKPVEWTELTWKDIVELEGIINNVHYDFCNGIGQESFGKEVLERFRSTKGIEYLDEAEQKYWREEEQKPVWNKDEKVRRWILEYFYLHRDELRGASVSDMDILNYLEKQKEQKPEDRFEEAREKYQVEWSEEEEQMFYP